MEIINDKHPSSHVRRDSPETFVHNSDSNTRETDSGRQEPVKLRIVYVERPPRPVTATTKQRAKGSDSEESESRGSRDGKSSSDDDDEEKFRSDEKRKEDEDHDEEVKLGKRQQQQQQQRKTTKGNDADGKMEERIRSALSDWDESRRRQILEEQRQRETKKKRDDRDKADKEKRRRDTLLQELKQELLDACEQRDIDQLESSVEHVRAHNCVKQLQSVYDRADALLTSLLRVRHLDDALAELSQSHVTELRSYKKPRDVVHKSVRAAALLVGVDTETTKDWPSCKPLFVGGRDGLYKQMLKFDLDALDSQTAKKAMRILDGVKRQDVLVVSGTATIFYDWTVGHCELRLQADSCDDKDKNKNKKKSPAAERY